MQQKKVSLLSCKFDFKKLENQLQFYKFLWFGAKNFLQLQFNFSKTRFCAGWVKVIGSNFEVNFNVCVCVNSNKKNFNVADLTLKFDLDSVWLQQRALEWKEYQTFLQQLRKHVHCTRETFSGIVILNVLTTFSCKMTSEMREKMKF